MSWDLNFEDFEHRQRRVKMFKFQNMSHDAISNVFQQEFDSLQTKQGQQQQKRAIEETEIQQQTELDLKKAEVLDRINEEVKKMETVYDDAETLAYYLRKDYFDRVQPNSDNTVIIIATQKSDKWCFQVTCLPNPIYDLTKITSINIVKGD